MNCPRMIYGAKGSIAPVAAGATTPFFVENEKPFKMRMRDYFHRVPVHCRRDTNESASECFPGVELRYRKE